MVIVFKPCAFLQRSVMAYLLLALLIALGGVGVARATTDIEPLAVKPVQVVLLLHGLNSNLKTWNKLVNSTAGFDGHCTNPREASFATVKMLPNSEGVYCTRINFGSLDRIATAPKGLDDKICAQSGGCSGDYSTYESLGQEINIAIPRIVKKFGSNVQIVLLGHSRGGLAARAFLQSGNSFRKYVVGLITTGTPHAGSPLGRFYTYMKHTCLPQSKYDSVIDFSACADDWRFVDGLYTLSGLDLKAPSIYFLSDLSPNISVLNTKVKVAQLPAIKMAQISYNNVKFGCLGGGVIHPSQDCGFDVFGITPPKPSDNALNAVLNGQARSTFIGDGIVPDYSQKMTLLKGWKLPVRSYAKLNRVHTAETTEILDLTTTLTNMYKQLGWVL